MSAITKAHLVPLAIALSGIGMTFLVLRSSGTMFQKKPAAPPLPLPPSPKSSASLPAAYATLREGMTGPVVQKLQVALGEPTSGTFSPSLTFAVKQFQSSHGLTPDGVVGPMTWAKLGV
jgi:peptidoglycan hydrolase-like protein with peptidoglycan-binding domain